MTGGAQIDSYQVVRELGRGGMGVVLEVRRGGDPRRLALKRLTGEVDEEGLQRFAREAQLLARLRHPGVVRIHSYEVRGPFAPYLVSELIEGVDLTALRSRGPLDPRHLAELMIQLSEAVGALHAAGLVHRDLKPGNVMVRAADGRPILIDFGLAFDLLARQRLTEEGILLGTPVFMAPEQIATAGRLIDARTDVYGLGGTMFFLLFGRNPYDGVGAAAARAVVDEDPRWPPRARHPQLPEALWTICARALAKVPAQRYPSPAALREDLERFLEGRPLADTPARARAWWRPLAAGAVVATLVASALAWAGREVAAPTSPAPSRVPSAEPSASPSPAQTQATAELERLLRVPDDRVDSERLQVLGAWLEAHPGHPEAARAERRRAGWAARFPLQVWSGEAGSRLLACGSRLIAVRPDGALERLRPGAARGEAAGRLPRPATAEGFSQVEPGPEGRWLDALDDSALHGLDLETGERRRLVLQPGSVGRGFARSRSGQLVAVRSRLQRRHVLTLYDAARGEALWSRETEAELTGVGFSPRGSFVFCLTNDMHGGLLAPLLLFDVGSGAERVVPTQLSQKGNAWVLEPGGEHLLVGDNGGGLHRFDLAAPEAPPVMLRSEETSGGWVTRGVHATAVTALAATALDREWVAFSACGLRRNEPRLNELAVWRFAPGGPARLVRKWGGLPSRYVGLAVSADGRGLLATRDDGQLELWDAQALARE